MSVFGAFDTAVSGMAAQATALTNISQNISNSSTVGYKSVDTQFNDLVLTSDGTDLSSSLAGVNTVTRQNNTVAGTIQSTGNSTDLAINGGGFLVVNTNSTASSGQYLATRAGSFRSDANGNLVNAAGYFLQGVPLNADGTPVGGNSGNTLTSLSTVNISNISAATAPTQNATFAANLPSSDTAYSTTTPTPDTSTIDYYDALGQSHTLTMTFTPQQPAAAGDPQTNSWTMTIDDSASATNPITTAQLTFNGSGTNAGTLASVDNTATPPVALPGYNATTGDISITTGTGQAISLNIGALNSPTGMTQYAGSYQTTKVTTDGSGFGLLQNVNVTSSGIVTANFSNGTSRPIYQLKLANSPNPDGMTAENGDAWAFSPASGVPTLDTPGVGFAGDINGGSLEGSNVDITTQLTNLIETQRAYSSNATVIQTGSQMLQVVNQLGQG